MHRPTVRQRQQRVDHAVIHDHAVPVIRGLYNPLSSSMYALFTRFQ